MFPKHLLFIAVAATVLFSGRGPACGEEYNIGEVTVSSKKEELQKGSKDATGFVSIIKPEDLPSQVTSVAEVLDHAAGVTVTQYGGMGSFSTISIRGSSANQVSIYLDGILLNTANSGAVNLADIPIDNVEKIEVYRGTSPAKFAASGIGGVVNIITKKVGRAGIANVNYSYGSFHTHKANAYFAGQHKKINYSLFFNRTQSRGDFAFKDDKGTAYNSEDGEWTHRKNNDFFSDNFLFKARYDFTGGFVLDVSADLFNKEQGVPGISNYQSREADLKTLRSLSHIKLIKENFIVPELSMEFFFSHSYQRQKFRDLQGEIGVGKQDNRDETENFKARLFLSYLLGEHQIISVLCEGSEETFQSRDSFASLGDVDTTRRIGYLYGFTEKVKEGQSIKKKSDVQKRMTYTVSLEDEIYLFNERLLFSPSVKVDYYDDDFGGKVPFFSMAISDSQKKTKSYVTRKMGASWKILNWLELKGNVGKYFRVPKMYELFGDRGAIVGNPDLQPEESINWDLGFSVCMNPFSRWLKSFVFEYAYFNSEIDDLILFMQNSQRTSVAKNISSAEISGHEFFWRILFAWPISISGNLTLQDARDKSDIAYWKGNRLPGRPAYELFNRTEVFMKYFSVFHEFEYMDTSYLDRANVRKIEGRHFHNAGISFSPVKKIVFTFEVKNIFDEHEEDVIGYPLPGRAFYGTVAMTF